MEVNDKLIDKIAHLSRLEFHDSEKQQIKKDMQEMIAFIDKLNEPDTSGIDPLLHISNNVNCLREDEVNTPVSQDRALMNSSHHDKQFFKVPKVITKS